MTTPTTLCPTIKCPTTPTDGYADRGLCVLCEARGRDAVEKLPAAHRDLCPLVREKPATGLGTTGGKFGPSVPLNLAADALVREIRYVVEQWDEIIRHRARLGKGTLSVADGCRTLAAFWPVLLSCGPITCVLPNLQIVDLDGPAAILWFTDLHYRAVKMLGQTAMTIHLPGICPNCRRPDLRHRDGDDNMWCDHCRTHWPWQQYALHVDMLSGVTLV